MTVIIKKLILRIFGSYFYNKLKTFKAYFYKFINIKKLYYNKALDLDYNEKFYQKFLIILSEDIKNILKSNNLDYFDENISWHFQFFHVSIIKLKIF